MYEHVHVNVCVYIVYFLLFYVKFADEISEESVMKKLTIKDKVFLALVHLYVLYTGTLPISATGFHGNTVPITIANTVSTYLYVSILHDRYILLVVEFFPDTIF